jgi:hypothetical protein
MRFPCINPLDVLIASVVRSLGAHSSSTHGPVRGTLVLHGGVGDNRAIAAAFVTAAGGPASYVVVIPTASVFDEGPPDDDYHFQSAVAAGRLADAGFEITQRRTGSARPL